MSKVQFKKQGLKKKEAGINFVVNGIVRRTL